MIKIYTSPTCGKCKQIKDFCEKNQIQFELIDITQDYKARARLLALNRISLPVVETDNQLLSTDINMIKQELLALKEKKND